MRAATSECCGGDICLLGGVAPDIVKGIAAHQAPAVPDHGGIATLQAVLVKLHDQHAVVKAFLRALQQARQAGAVEGGTPRLFQSAEVGERRQQVLHLRLRADVAPMPEAAGRPAHETRHAVAAVEQTGLAAAHAGVVELHAGDPAVVRHEDQDGVVAQAGPAEEGVKPAKVLIQVCHHSEVRRWALAIVELAVLLRHPLGEVRRVRREIAEKRLTAAPASVHPRHGLVEPHVGAVALGPPRLAVVQVAGIEIVVVPVVAGSGQPESRESRRPREIRDPLAGADSCSRGATSRRCRCCNRRTRRAGAWSAGLRASANARRPWPWRRSEGSPVRSEVVRASACTWAPSGTA